MARSENLDPHRAGRALWEGRLLTRPSLCALVVAVIGLTVYLVTLPPGLTWANDSADGGELAAAAHTLGIPHPPGYPTYVLLAHPFTLLPLGEVASGTNLFSSLCAAIAAGAVAWSVARLTTTPAAAIGAGLALALSPLLWSQAIVTEAHALNALFTALLLALAVAPRQDTRRFSLAVGLVWGLGMGNHLTVLFCAPLVALAVGRAPKQILSGLAGLALGLGVYLYLPLRAAASPPVNWGDPQSLDRFWWMVSGGPYRLYAFSLPLQHLPARLTAWAGLLTRQFSALGLVLSFVGATTAPKERRAILTAAGATLLLCSIFAVGYNTSDSYLYLLPGMICLALWLGIGIDWLIRTLASQARWLGRPVSLLAAALPLLLGLWRVPTVDLGDDTAAGEFGNATLSRVPPEAILLSQEDAHTFTWWYLQHAEDRRLDVIVVDLGLVGYNWYDAQLVQAGVASEGIALLTVDYDRRAEVSRITGRSVCWIEGDTVLSCTE